MKTNRQKWANSKYRNDILRYGSSFVSTVKLQGWQEEPMYDDHPDLATFRVLTSVEVSLAPQSLAQAKLLISSEFVQAAWNGTEHFAMYGTSTHANHTGVTGVEVLDNFGNVVAEASVAFDGEVRWVEVNPMTNAEIAEIERRAREIEAEASFEAGWDNFSTAQALRSQAGSFRRMISIAKNARRLVTH